MGIKVLIAGAVPLGEVRPYQTMLVRAARIMAVTVEHVENPANGAHSLSAFAHGARIAEMKQFIADLSALTGGAENSEWDQE